MRLPLFSSSFHEKYLIGANEARCRKFTPKSFFHTLIELVAGTNTQGYCQALLACFGATQMPVKSALAKMRKRIKFTFFKDQFESLLTGFEDNRARFRGLHIYAIDGLQVLLPRCADLVDRGYTGRAVSQYRDTYYPRMYLTHAYDVLSGVTKDLREFSTLNEIADAADMVPHFEKDSLTLYDRLYICKKLVLAHLQKGSFFLFRCRRGGVPAAITKFFSSHKKIASFTWPKTKHRIYLIKVKNHKTGRYDVFATNLPKSWREQKTIGDLYGLRWEVETSFRDLVHTSMKLEQWHSKSYNGILQELYASFWLWNYMKIQTYLHAKKTENPLFPLYKKPNYKLILGFIVKLMPKLLKRVRGVLGELTLLINKSTERRLRRFRRYKRVLKTPASPYPRCNTLWTLGA